MSRSRQKRDPYEILGVERSADVVIIKSAYRKLAVKYHPDKNPGDIQAEESFKEVSEAYEILSDTDKRAAFDRYGHAAFGGGAGGGFPGGFGGDGGFHDPFDLFREVMGSAGGIGGIFEQFFGGGGGAGNSGRGSDLRYDLEITLEEAAFGSEKEIEVRKLHTCGSCSGSGGLKGAKSARCHVCRGSGQVAVRHGFFQVAQECPHCRGMGQIIDNPCPDCRGEGRREKTSRMKIKVPPGIEEGSRLRSTGGGEAGLRGSTAGDLYVFIHLKEHKIFIRDGEDLHCTMPIAFAIAALGGEVKVPILGGTYQTLKIPAGTQSNALFRLKSQGVTVLHSTRRGDLLVRIHVEVPTKLNAEQHAALEAFSKLCGIENTPMHKSFCDRVKDFFTN